MREKLKLYLVTDSDILKGRDFYESIEEALKAGVKTVQLREKKASGKEFLEKAYKLRELTKKYNAILIINDRVDIAMLVGADGVHIGQSDIPCSEVRHLIGNDKIIGVSTQNLALSLKAKNDGADYIGVGSMFTTTTKLDAKHVSIEELRSIKENIDIPIVCIGGINLSNISTLKNENIDGYAIVSEILKYDDIYGQTKKFMDII